MDQKITFINNILTGADKPEEIIFEKKPYEEELEELAKKMSKPIRFQELIVGGENDPQTSYDLTFGGRVFKK